MKKLLTYLLQGLLYTVPAGLTILILYKIFILIDSLLGTYLNKIFQYKIPGLGVLIIIVFLIAAGFIGKRIITQPLISFFGRMLDRAPLIKVIYTSLKDLLSAFVGKERKFNQPVLVRINKESQLEKIGFVTQNDVTSLGIADKKVVVYFPHSYAFSGEHYIVPTENVTRLDLPPADVMKFIVSGGVTNINKSNSSNQ